MHYARLLNISTADSDNAKLQDLIVDYFNNDDYETGADQEHESETKVTHNMLEEVLLILT